MTQAIVRAIIEDHYDYRLLDDFIDENKLNRIRQNLINKYSRRLPNWDEKLNTQWVLRNYLAIKMIMSTTLMLNSLLYSKDKNLRIVTPYLRYYSLLTVCRAMLFACPDIEWNDGELVKMNHSKIIKTSINAIKGYDKELSQKIGKFILLAQDIREMYSYRFPANGSDPFEDDLDWIDELIEYRTSVAEIAQFQSEQLQKTLRKLPEDYDFTIDYSILKQGYIYEGREFTYIDSEDKYRLEYFVRKQPYPLNLYWTLREGMVEDFFGIWNFDQEEFDINSCDDMFDSDEDIQLIFDMP